MRLDPTELERRLGTLAPVRVAVAFGAPGEESATGRRALRALRRRLGDLGPGPLRFPHPRCSLSHTAGVAVAVGVLDAASRGIGLDVERARPIAEGVERFYLSEQERRRFAGVDRLRLWTLKEAMFKADAENASTRLHHYELCTADPGSGLGISRSGARFRYASIELDHGFLSLAVAM